MDRSKQKVIENTEGVVLETRFSSMSEHDSEEGQSATTAATGGATGANPRILREDAPLLPPSDEHTEGKPHGWELFFSNDLRAFYLACVHFFMFTVSFFPLNICIYYGQTVSSDDKYVNYYMSLALGLGIICSRSLVAVLENFCGEHIGGMLQTKVNQCGACLTLIVLGMYADSSVTLTGATMGIAVYVFFQSGCIVLVPLRTIEVLGKGNHLTNVAVQYFIVGVAVVIGSYCAGTVLDHTSDFQYVFLFVASAFPVSLILDEIFFKKASLYHYLTDPGNYVII